MIFHSFLYVYQRVTNRGSKVSIVGNQTMASWKSKNKTEVVWAGKINQLILGGFSSKPCLTTGMYTEISEVCSHADTRLQHIYWSCMQNSTHQFLWNPHNSSHVFKTSCRRKGHQKLPAEFSNYKYMMYDI